MRFLYYLATVSAILLGAGFQYYMVTTNVPFRHPYLFVAVTDFGGAILWTVNNYVLPDASAAVDLILILGTLLSAALFATKGGKLKAALAMTIQQAVQIASMYIVGLFAFPIAEKLGLSAMDLVDKKDSFTNAIMSLICLGVYCPLSFGAKKVLDWLFRKQEITVWILCFLPIPISQMIIVNLITRIVPYAGGTGGMSAVFTAGILFSIAADISFFVGVYRILQSNQLKDQIRMANEQLEVQTGYYRQLQESILSVNQIRHDLNNQLQAAYRLLERGETDQVRQQLDGLRDSIQNRVGPRYSNNLMADAVLQDKVRRCREEGIALTISAEIPSELPMANAHLCSALSNILDNSIQGALKSGAEKPGIDLRVVFQAGCLIIRCVNSAAAGAASGTHDPLRSHGLGLEILARLAKRYNGTLEYGFRDGQFDTTLIFHFEARPEEAPEARPLPRNAD